MTAYDAGATWQPQAATSGEAVFALLANTVRACVAPAHVMRVLARGAAGARVLRGSRGDAGATAQAILATLDADRQ
jgi:hypothetical protein